LVYQPLLAQALPRNEGTLSHIGYAGSEAESLRE